MKISAAFLNHPLTPLFAALFFLPYILVHLGSTVSLATEILIFILVCLGFNILLGYTGLVSFGHGAYFGLATYACALTQIHFYKGMAVPLLAGVLTGTALGVIVGFLIMRKRGVYFALLTLAFTQMFFYMVYRATSVTGGENGLGGIERLPISIPGLLTLDLSEANTYYYFVYAIFILAACILWRIVRSPFGCTLQAIRENDQRARCVGYDTKRYRYLAFIISCTFAGLAGALYVFLLNFAYPESVGWVMGGDIVVMTVVGGMRSFFGPVIGAAFFVFLRDFLTTYTENWLIIFGSLFMIFILFSPRGIIGIIEKITRTQDRTMGFSFDRHALNAGPAGDPAKAENRTGERTIWKKGDAHAPIPDGGEFLACKGVVKRFGAFTAVDGVDLVIRKGEIRSIIGPNGAGKTTLFNCLTGLLPVDGGKVIFKGEEISKSPPYRVVSKGIARSFQITSIFKELTVFENVRIAVQSISHHRFDLFARTEKLEHINREALRIINEIGLSGKEDVTASSLSHGDQRLLEIGIALATHPELLMLDEPLAGLSSGESARITEFIRKLAERLTILLIEHKIDSVLALSQRITVMHQGRIIAEGTPEEIQKNPDVQEAYLGRVRLDSAEHKGAPAIIRGEKAMFRVEGINTFYGKSHVLRNVSLDVNEGEVVCLLGRNGAGKTTTLRSIMGTTPPRNGSIFFKGQEIAKWPPEEVVRLGIGLVPQGKRIFPNLTVAENLRIASRNGANAKWDLERVFHHFPKLEKLKNSRGETLSGGELQMLAVGRALMGNVDLLMLDEPFEGLAPTIIQDIAQIIREIRNDTTILLVEQNAGLALALSDRAYVINSGEIIYKGMSSDLARDERLKKDLLGV